MDFDYTDLNEQLDWLDYCKSERLIDREMQIRDLAQKLAKSQTSYAPSIAISGPTLQNVTANYPPSTTCKTTNVNIGPQIQGDARVLLIEKILREEWDVHL